MLGRIRWSDERRIRAEQEFLMGMRIQVLYLPRCERGLERRMRKGVDLLKAYRVNRVLVPPDFVWWPLLKQLGLRPVETRSLRCTLVSDWVKTVMESAGILPQRAVVRLNGERETSDVLLAAHQLCPIIRNLVIDVPGGEKLTAQLRREYGIPVLPAKSARADLTVWFEEGPVLKGASFGLKDCNLPLDCEVLPLLSALWECGRIKTEDIAILI